MELPCITLYTKEKGHFDWRNGYTNVNASELETLLKISREIVRSLEAEVKARQLVVKPEQSNAVSDCADKLRKSAENFKILERLEQREARLVVSAISVLKDKQETRDGKIYQAFLHDVYYQCSRGLVVLSAASLGKQRVVALNAGDRVGLLQYLKSNQDALTSSALNSLPDNYQIPDESELYKPEGQRSAHPRSLKRKATHLAEEDASENSTPQCRRLDIEETAVLRAAVMKTAEDHGAPQADAGLAEEPPSFMESSQHKDAIPLERQIEYRFSEAPVDRISRLVELLPSAIRSSKQWTWERRYGGLTTDCLNVLSPKNREQDISITIMVGFKEGMQLVEDLDLQNAT